jgi:hypothetical protein
MIARSKMRPMLDAAATLVHPQREILLMKSSATTVEECLQSLPADRRLAINAVRLPYAILGSQKNHMALHLMPVYADPATEKWFCRTWTDAGKKIDMGKACVRFKKLEDIPLDVIGQVTARTLVKEYIACIEKVIGARAGRRGKIKPKKSPKAN